MEIKERISFDILFIKNRRNFVKLEYHMSVLRLCIRRPFDFETRNLFCRLLWKIHESHMHTLTNLTYECTHKLKNVSSVSQSLYDTNFRFNFNQIAIKK